MRIIHLGNKLPYLSSNLPESSDGPSSNTPLFGLALDGVYLAALVTKNAGALLPHPFTVTQQSLSSLLSVALACESPRPGVTRHPAL